MQPCFVCGKVLPGIDFSCSDEPELPFGGTIFKTYGHYGSTVFDEIGRRYLRIVICDEHLVEASAIRVCAEANIVTVDMKPWRYHDQAGD